MSHSLRNLALLLIMIFSLSGCATDGDKMRGTGAGAGAVIGGVLGYVLGGEQGAALGALIGAGAGFALGHEVTKRKEKYANAEEAIIGETAQVEQVTQQTRAANQQLTQDIQTNQQAIARLEADRNQGQATQAALQEQYKQVAQLRDQAQQALTAVENELKVQQELYAEYQEKAQSNASQNAGDLEKWQTKIAQLEQEKQALNSNVDTLMAMSPTI